MENDLKTIEPAAKVLAATALSQSLSFCLERKYLQGVANSSLFELVSIPKSLESEASWISITQVGKPVDKTSETCFTAIQKILYSCFLPKEMQLLFLVVGQEGENHLFLGVRTPGKATPPKSLVRNLNEFLKGIWPGLQSSIVHEDYSPLHEFKNSVVDGSLENVYAFTGIPSMESQYKTIYPATIDKLIAGMNRSKQYAYFVVADPVETADTEYMLYQCREMNGQAESLKSMNVTEGFSQGSSKSFSKSHTDSHTSSVSESISKKDFSKLGKLALSATGLGLAASIFPAAGTVLEGCADAAGALTSTAANLLGGAMVGNFISGLMPQKTTSTSESDTSSDSTTETIGTNDSKSHSLSRNVVNKHIESVSEHLFYHSKRLEAGKAIGLWKVGVYLMANKTSDLQAGALQLRSILSGQESIFEPIRIHDISAILDDEETNRNTIRQQTLGHFFSPSLFIETPKGKPFEHPLGDHYKELKTVLTTKELSYLINFPLRTVPGISIVDSSPEFSLNKPVFSFNSSVINFGKLMYGGTVSELDYQLPIDTLVKHTLLSGINGTGKTNTVHAILNSLNGQLPFLVIEPAKTEYVDWAIEYNKTHLDNPISIFIPGCKNYKNKISKGNNNLKDLHLNPFEVVWLSVNQEPNVLSHIDRLKSTLAAAFPMYDILPVLMEDLIYAVYQNKTTDWLNSIPEYGITKAPTLNSMSVAVNNVVERCGYEKHIEGNLKACLNTRINSLKRGWRGDTLNCVRSTNWDALFEKPCVINLSYVGDDVDKAFFMALILQFLYEYCQAKAELGMIDYNDNRCKHLTIIEEAHRVMMKCDNPELPQYKSAMMFSNMLSEIRAYGEGMLLVDQIPTRLIPDAIKNTNIKITHRLVAEDDCKAMAESMGMSDEQKKMIPKLLVGQCLISTSHSPDKHWVIVNKVK